MKGFENTQVSDGGETLSAQKKIETPEIGSETKEVVEVFREERLSILTSVFDRIAKEFNAKVSQPAKTLLSTGANYLGVPGAIKMVGEAVKGQTVSGERLTPLGRINHLLIQGTNALAYYSAFNGEFSRAGVAYSASWILDGVQYYPKILQALGELAGKYNLEKTGRFFQLVNTVLDRANLRKLFFKEETPDES